MEPEMLMGLIGGGGSGGSGGKPPGAGAALSLATGALQSLQAAALKRKADSAMPDLIDPNQSSYLAELNQKRRSIETGAAFAGANRAADMSQAAASNAIVGSSGGDVGSTLQGLLQSQVAAGDVKNRAIAQGQNNQFAYDTAYGNYLDKISGRSLQLQHLRSQQARAEEMQKKTYANQNINAGLASVLSGNQPQAPQTDFGGGAQASPPSALSSLSPSMSNVVPETPTPNVVPQKTLAMQALGPQL